MAKIELQKCHKEKIAEICSEFGNGQGELISILHKCQGEFGYIPEEVQREVAKCLKMPIAKVYGVVTFYSYFTMTAKGKYNISICMGTACYVRGAEIILEEIKNFTGIDVGQVTEDGMFSIDSLRCVGACGLAPVMLVGEKVYGRLQPGMVAAILAKYE